MGIYDRAQKQTTALCLARSEGIDASGYRSNVAKSKSTDFKTTSPQFPYTPSPMTGSVRNQQATDLSQEKIKQLMQ